MEKETEAARMHKSRRAELKAAKEQRAKEPTESATEQERFEFDVTVRKLYEVESETKRIHIVAYTKGEALRKLEKAMRDESMR